jgi:membrane-bound lytic murein transglycosylase B
LKAVVALGAMLGGCTGGPGEDRSALSATASVPGVAAVPQAASVRRSYAQATGPEWSGESGGSGHPLMQADAIRQSAANFQNCLQGMYPAAAKRGVSKVTFDTYTRDMTPDLRIMDLVDAQPEFTKSFWDYLDILVSEERIARGRAVLAENRATFDAMERQYGVDRYVIAASARCCVRPRRSPVSGGGRIISETNSWPRSN